MYRFPGVGIRLPVMMGVTFASVGPMLSMAAAPDVGLLGIYGSVIAAGIFGIVAAPFISRLLPLFPPVVLGGAGLVMFGMVAATGARILATVDFKNNQFNLFVVAISVGFGMIPLVAPNFFKNLPHDLHPLLESGILLCALVAVILNAFFNGVSSKAAAEADAAATASSAQHV